MLRVKDIKIGVDNNTEEHIINKVSKLLNDQVLSYKIVKKSIDARDANNMLYVYTLDYIRSQQEYKHRISQKDQHQ